MKPTPYQFFGLITVFLTPAFGQNMGNFRVQQSFNQTESPYVQAKPGSGQASALDPGKANWQVNLLHNAKPSAQIAIFNVLQIGETADEARRLAGERIQPFLKDLAALGLSPDDLYVDFISFVPVYAQEPEKKLFSKTLNEAPRGFELQQNVHVRFREPAQLESILAAATRQEIYDLLKVEYVLADQDHILARLRAQAFDLLAQKLRSLDSLGIRLDSLGRSAEESFRIITPQERYLTFPAANPGFEALKRKTGLALPNTTMKGMYNRLSYHEFDAVVNPDLVQPAIQVVYTLRLAATPAKAPAPANRYFWLTPEGTSVPVFPAH